MSRISSGTGSAYWPQWARDATDRRIVVLGADGFIGSHVVEAAARAGANPVCVCVKDPWRLRDGRTRCAVVRVPGGGWWKRDFFPTLRRVVERADALVMLAYQPPTATAADDRLRHEFSVNASGARHIAEAAFAARARVVFTSTADVYGASFLAPIDERVPPRPVTPYARAKLAAERLLAEAADGEDSLVTLRIATVFGPGDNGPRAIPSFVRSLGRGDAATIHGDGSDVRDYVHVSDVATAIVNACVVDGAERTVLNLGSGVGRSTLSILDAVAASLGVEPRARHEPTRRPPTRIVLDSSAARSVLGFQPRADFGPALQEEVAWLRAHHRRGGATGQPLCAGDR